MASPILSAMRSPSSLALPCRRRRRLPFAALASVLAIASPALATAAPSSTAAPPILPAGSEHWHTDAPPAVAIPPDPGILRPRRGTSPPCPADTRPRQTSGPFRDAPMLLARGRGHPDRPVRVALYREVESLAEARLALDPHDIEARWWRVAAVGLRLDEEGPREKIRLARFIHGEAEWILERDPHHPGAHHALGRLHAGILRLNPVLRFFALRMVGEEELRHARWEDAERHLRAAIAAEPCLLHHRYELARILEDQGRRAEALEERRKLLALPDLDPMDPVVRGRITTRRQEME